MKRLVAFFAITFLYFPSLYTKPRTIPHEPIEAVVFDLNDVFIKENVSAFIKELGGFGNVASYVLSHWKNPVDRALDALEQMNKQDRSELVWGYKGRQMPGCVVNWYRGTVTEQQVKEKLLSYVEHLDQKKFFKSKQEKELIVRMMQCAFDHDKMPGLIKLINPTVDIATQLKHKGYKIYLCANLAPEPYDVFVATFPDEAKQFDGVVISGHVKQLKPDQKIFEHMFKTHNINPHRCLYVDAQKENIVVAEKMGLHVIKFGSASQLKKQLKHYKLI